MIEETRGPFSTSRIVGKRLFSEFSLILYLFFPNEMEASIDGQPLASTSWCGILNVAKNYRDSTIPTGLSRFTPFEVSFTSACSGRFNPKKKTRLAHYEMTIDSKSLSKKTHTTLKFMVGRLLSFWYGIVSGAMLSFQGVSWNWFFSTSPKRRQILRLDFL